MPSPGVEPGRRMPSSGTPRRGARRATAVRDRSVLASVTRGPARSLVADVWPPACVWVQVFGVALGASAVVQLSCRRSHDASGRAGSVCGARHGQGVGCTEHADALWRLVRDSRRQRGLRSNGPARVGPRPSLRSPSRLMPWPDGSVSGLGCRVRIRGYLGLFECMHAGVDGDVADAEFRAYVAKTLDTLPTQPSRPGRRRAVDRRKHGLERRSSLFRGFYVSYSLWRRSQLIGWSPSLRPFGARSRMP